VCPRKGCNCSDRANSDHDSADGVHVKSGSRTTRISAMTSNQRFLPRMHIRRPQDFERVYESGLRAGDGHLLVFALKNDLGYSRLGLSVSRKHGPAVSRNRKRRRLRESFRLIQQQLSVGLDLVLVPRHRTDSTQADYRNSILQLTERLSRRLLRPSLPSGPSEIDPEVQSDAAPESRL